MSRRGRDVALRGALVVVPPALALVAALVGDLPVAVAVVIGVVAKVALAAAMWWLVRSSRHATSSDAD